RFLSDCRGSPAAEFVLVLPIVLALMFGGLEAGHFFWTEHKLVKAVRDGARFASRLPVEDLCEGDTVVMDADVEANIQNITATGALSGGTPKVPGWDPTDVTVTVGCQEFVSTGIFTALGGAAPMVTVSTGSVPYPSLFAGLGFIDSSFDLSARSSAAVLGI
ncbi:MAG TPA: TadE/TadG family type IV pilus assembly protein, partial [Croceibacterium sp.]|nr:TadE/TadG family type IV pilus assembly protein [Croceibacterium sp.]